MQGRRSVQINRGGEACRRSKPAAASGVIYLCRTEAGMEDELMALKSADAKIHSAIAGASFPS